MKSSLIFLFLLLFVWSCTEDVKIDPNKKLNANPMPCFQIENDICDTNKIPMPSDFMYSAMPENTELNLSNDIPFTMAFSDEIDKNTLENNVIVLEDGIPFNDFNISLHPNSPNVLIISPKDIWKPYHKYSVLLLKGIKSVKGKKFVETPAFYYAKSQTALIDGNGKSAISVLSDKEAEKLEKLRLAYKEPLKQLEEGLSKKRSDFLMLWSVTVKENFIPCFVSKNIKGCEQFDEVPFPSDFIMKDNHLNLPLPENADEETTALINGINEIDGWSINNPFLINLSEDIDEETIKSDFTNLNELSIAVLKLTENGGIPVETEIKWDKDLRTLRIKPANSELWKEKSTYVVVLTDKLKNKNSFPLIKSTVFSIISSKTPLTDENGNSLYAGLDNEKAQKLETLRLKMAPLFEGLEKSGINRKNIALTYTVTTQNVSDELTKAALTLLSGNSPVPPSPTSIFSINNSQIPFAVQQAGINPDDLARRLGYEKGSDLYKDIYYIILGSVDLANYIDRNKNSWNSENIPDSPRKETVRFYMTFPFPHATDTHVDYCPMPPGGFPVIIFQHGLTGSKDQIFGFANELAKNCYITIAIDAVEHGDRTYLGTESGEKFFTADMFSSRDNIRQTVVDLVQLYRAVKEMGTPPYPVELPEGIEINPEQISFLGVSLGGIIGSIFITVNPEIKGGILNVAGGGLTDILMMTRSERIKEPIITALREKGIEEGTPQFERYLQLGQLVLDRGDPIAYAVHTIREPLNTGNTIFQPKRILLQKADDDEVIPNYTTDHLALISGIYSEEDTDSFKTYYPEGTYALKHAFAGYNESESQRARQDMVDFFNELFSE